MCSLGARGKPNGPGGEIPPRAPGKRSTTRGAPPIRALVKSLHCCSACDLQQISTMKAAVLLATAAHAAKQAVEEPAESPVACVPASLPN